MKIIPPRATTLPTREVQAHSTSIIKAHIYKVSYMLARIHAGVRFAQKKYSAYRHQQPTNKFTGQINRRLRQ